MRGKTDAELMELVRARHRPALEEVYDRYVRLVYSFALKSVKEEQGAREIVQGVFTRIWTTRKGYDPDKGQFVSWLLTVTRNMAIDHVRKEQRSSREVPLEAEEWERFEAPTDQGPEAVITRALTREEIRQAYRHLSSNQIRLLERVYWEGYTLSEVASEANEPLGTIKSRLHQTLKLLRQSIQKQREG
ncbi:sigma-70 family RNA polymerase sigma factor [Paenibacillus aurantius]|uniref:Sigma-70 family RNA polymerase sigma factor n=1 Tax=Paenibacillus aurantius TaxID=2918900 RepID=A0AA96RBF2_9BACL|nr:sigma-70 family RNA polymerase sigma factor [Paenibacillus aurantius]WJH34319.1 sigma-70 family RNA polymerase sigma factor [Paenibacillus sp. CC-CFT747]WNQ09430.1 sigma-70 family RNA polymerase sigma factor [Paenibacillus aurantius]